MSKILFISYSHDSEAHKAWVKKFANDLENLGDFEVLLDQNMPKGFPLTRFMEKGMDTIKYYPILRSGTFETSFPIALQGRTGDDMSDDAKYNLTLQAIADSITNEKPIPSALKHFSTSEPAKLAKFTCCGSLIRPCQ